MSATLVSPVLPDLERATHWRFASAGADEGGVSVVQWQLRRNCSMTPRQLGIFYVSICLVSLLIATGFALSGAPVVLAFAGIELVLVGVALLVYARHATDADTLVLSDRELRVDQSDGTTVRTARFRAEWVRVEPASADGSLVELSGEGQRVRVGRFLRPELRAAFAQELRLALRRGVPARAPSPVLPA